MGASKPHLAPILSAQIEGSDLSASQDSINLVAFKGFRMALAGDHPVLLPGDPLRKRSLPFSGNALPNASRPFYQWCFRPKNNKYECAMPQPGQRFEGAIARETSYAQYRSLTVSSTESVDFCARGPRLQNESQAKEMGSMALRSFSEFTD